MFSYKESLGRVLIHHKICSQRCAKNFIKKNQVLVNGSPVDDFRTKVDAAVDEIFVNGKRLEKYSHLYLVMNKPCGVVCSTVSDSHKTVYDLLKEKNGELNISAQDFFQIKCVGRLDCDTSGLLLLSTNGTFVSDMTAPEQNICKTYVVWLRDCVCDEEKNQYSKKILSGIKIREEKKSPAFVSRSAKTKWLSDYSLEITVTEGKFHEVRRIFFELGNFVVKLKRIKVGSFVLDSSLQEGDIKIL